MPKDLTPQKILSMLLRHIKLIFLITILVTLIAYGYSTFFITPVYSATSTIHIWNADENETQSQQTTYSNGRRVDTSKITQSTTLAANCVVIFQQSPLMTDRMRGASVNITQVNESNVIQFTVSSPNPNICMEVANNLAKYGAKECYKKFFGDYGKVTFIRGPQTAPTTPVSPNINRNTIFGAAIGFIIGVLLAFFLEIIDTTVKPGDDIAKLYGLPVFAEIVDFEKEG